MKTAGIVLTQKTAGRLPAFFPQSLPNVENEELDLCNQVIAGNARAMKALYDRYIGNLTSVCTRYVGNSDDVCDILQESFVQIFSSISRFQYKGKGSLRAWMTRIVVNKSIDFLKETARFGRVEIAETLPDIPDEDDPDIDEIPISVLHRMICELPTGYRTIFNLYVFEHLTHAEIARRLNIGESSSASQLHRAKQVLAQRIKTYRNNKQTAGAL